MQLLRIEYHESKNKTLPSTCFMCEDSNECKLEQYTDTVNELCEFAIREERDGELITASLVPLGLENDDGIEPKS